MPRIFFINTHGSKIHKSIIIKNQHILIIFFKSLSFILNIFKKFLKNLKKLILISLKKNSSIFVNTTMKTNIMDHFMDVSYVSFNIIKH